MDDNENELRARGNTDAPAPSRLYDDPDAGMKTTEPERLGSDARATYMASEFGREEERLKAQMAADEDADRERGKAWAEARKTERAQAEAHRLALAEEEAARRELLASQKAVNPQSRQPNPQTLRPKTEDGLLFRAAAILRSFFPSSGRRRAA